MFILLKMALVFSSFFVPCVFCNFFGQCNSSSLSRVLECSIRNPAANADGGIIPLDEILFFFLSQFLLKF